jgi:hypothetical protein
MDRLIELLSCLELAYEMDVDEYVVCSEYEYYVWMCRDSRASLNSADAMTFANPMFASV